MQTPASGVCASAHVNDERLDTGKHNKCIRLEHNPVGLQQYYGGEGLEPNVYDYGTWKSILRHMTSPLSSVSSRAKKAHAR
eukprot:SAG11_NODE_31649_length_290_cov_0.806283_1_plen_80_part_10